MIFADWWLTYVKEHGPLPESAAQAAAAAWHAAHPPEGKPMEELGRIAFDWLKSRYAIEQSEWDEQDDLDEYRSLLEINNTQFSKLVELYKAAGGITPNVPLRT